MYSLIALTLQILCPLGYAVMVKLMTRIRRNVTLQASEGLVGSILTFYLIMEKEIYRIMEYVPAMMTVIMGQNVV